MDVTAIVSGILLIGIIGVGWLWKRRGGAIHEAGKGVQSFLRRSLDAASSKDLEEMEIRLIKLHSQMNTRLRELETPKQIIPNAKPVFKENHSAFSVSQVEQQAFVLPHQTPPSSQQTIVFLGLRFTLNELLWAHAGQTPSEQLNDAQISSMLQGPFCLKCLKRIVGREGDQMADLPDNCRSCGEPWSKPGLAERPLKIKDLKRWVYNQVAEEIRRKIKERPQPDG